MIRKYHLEDHVKLLGFRTDVAELCQAADVFVFPSKQGGTSGSTDGSDGLWGSGSVQQNSGKHRSGKKWRERLSGKRRSAGGIYSGNRKTPADMEEYGRSPADEEK